MNFLTKLNLLFGRKSHLVEKLKSLEKDVKKAEKSILLCMDTLFVLEEQRKTLFETSELERAKQHTIKRNETLRCELAELKKEQNSLQEELVVANSKQISEIYNKFEFCKINIPFDPKIASVEDVIKNQVLSFALKHNYSPAAVREIFLIENVEYRIESLGISKKQITGFNYPMNKEEGKIKFTWGR